MQRSVASGESSRSRHRRLQRHFLRLHGIRGALDGGRSMERRHAVAAPAAHFERRAPIEQQAPAAGASPKLNATLARIAEAAKAARLDSALEDLHRPSACCSISAR